MCESNLDDNFLTSNYFFFVHENGLQFILCLNPFYIYLNNGIPYSAYDQVIFLYLRTAVSFSKHTVSFGKHSLRYLGPILWSKLDKSDKTCESLSDFRNRMRNRNLTCIVNDGCRGYYLCNSWCLIRNKNNIYIL